MASPSVTLSQLLAMAVMAALAISASFPSALASDADPLQDFCVADLVNKNVIVNGFPCKAAKDTEAKDFASSNLAKAAGTNNRNKATVTPLTVAQFAGLNTLGISGVRIDFGVGGLNPPHVHPRATELFFLVKGGPLEVGFVSTTGSILFQQNLNEGDVFVFPRGLVHFQKNRGYSPAFGLAALNSQNPGVQQSAQALFNSTPPISSDVLQQTLGVGAKAVQDLFKGSK